MVTVSRFQFKPMLNFYWKQDELRMCVTDSELKDAMALVMWIYAFNYFKLGNFQLSSRNLKVLCQNLQHDFMTPSSSIKTNFFAAKRPKGKMLSLSCLCSFSEVLCFSLHQHTIWIWMSLNGSLLFFFLALTEIWTTPHN